MGSFYSGNTGELQIGNPLKSVGKVRNWQFTSSVQMLTTTTLGDTDDTVTSGVRSQAGSFSLYYYDEPDNASTIYANTVIGKLVKAATAYATNPGVAAENDPFTLRLKINKGTTGVWVEGEVLLNSVSMQMAVGEVSSAQCQFTVKGAFKEVTI